MNGGSAPNGDSRLIGMGELESRDRYHLLTSLVVPRPIGWVSSRSSGGMKNLAPFSYFAPISPTPPLVSIAIGSRRGAPKDTLTNIRETRAFCINVVTESQLVEMNASSGEHPPEIDEFEIAGVDAAEATTVDAPYVAGCPAVLECRLYREVDFSEAGVFMIVGEISAVRIAADLVPPPGSRLVDPEALSPVARLGGELYGILGEIRSLARPIIRR